MDKSWTDKLPKQEQAELDKFMTEVMDKFMTEVTDKGQDKGMDKVMDKGTVTGESQTTVTPAEMAEAEEAAQSNLFAPQDRANQDRANQESWYDALSVKANLRLQWETAEDELAKAYATESEAWEVLLAAEPGETREPNNNFQAARAWVGKAKETRKKALADLEAFDKEMDEGLAAEERGVWDRIAFIALNDLAQERKVYGVDKIIKTSQDFADLWVAERRRRRWL